MRSEWTIEFGGGIGRYPTCTPPDEQSKQRQDKMKLTGLGLKPQSLSEQMDVLFQQLYRIEGYDQLSLRSQKELIDLIGKSVRVGLNA